MHTLEEATSDDLRSSGEIEVGAVLDVEEPALGEHPLIGRIVEKPQSEWNEEMKVMPEVSTMQVVVVVVLTHVHEGTPQTSRDSLANVLYVVAFSTGKDIVQRSQESRLHSS